MAAPWTTVLRRTAVVALGLFVVIQLVPYGWRHPNPPVRDSLAWDDPQAEQLARAACYDCHSNETEWPAYAYVAPMSWLVRYDVERGREELNFSDWGGERGDEADDAAETVEDGSMPPLQYRLLHPDARLSATEKATLIEALERLEDGRGDEDD